MQSLRVIQILKKYSSLKRPQKALQKNPEPRLMLCGSELVLQCSVSLTRWLEEAPLPFVLPFPPAVALLRRACSWSNSKSSRRCVKASFCWMAIRNREFRVFFSSSAAASCLCMSSSWVTYSSHLRGKERGENSKGGGRKKQEISIMSSRWRFNCCCHMFSPFPRQHFPDGRTRSLLAHSQYYIRLFPQCFVTFSQVYTWT